MDDKYLKALTRDDLSQMLIHLSSGGWVNGNLVGPKAAMMNILSEGRIRASERKEIRQYDPAGAAPLYAEIAETLPQALQRAPDGRCQILPCPDFGTPMGVG